MCKFNKFFDLQFVVNSTSVYACATSPLCPGYYFRLIFPSVFFFFKCTHFISTDVATVNYQKVEHLVEKLTRITLHE